jgi:hypothetical protein
MIEQTGQRDPEVTMAALEERVRALEGRPAVITDAIRVLAHGLEDLPMAEPGGRAPAEAARRAYELLLIAEPRRPGPQAAAPDA